MSPETNKDRLTVVKPPRISRKLIAIWCTQVSRLLEAGISLSESLELVIESQSDKKVRIFTSQLKTAVGSGDSGYLTLKAMKANNGLITAFEIGEMTGTLSKNLKDIGARIQSEDEFIKKISSLLIYPAIVSCAALGMVAFLIGYIFPKIMPVFTGMKMKLPIATRAMIALVNGFQAYWWAIGLVIILVVLAWIIVWRKSNKFSGFVFGIVLRLPHFGNIIRMYHVARLVRLLSTYIASGQSLSHAFTAYNSGNIVLSSAVKDMKNMVENGIALSSVVGMNKYGVFPKDFGAFVAIGERSGSLLQSFELVTEMYEKKIKSSLESLTAFIEPGLMIMIGIFVGWISMSIILPMYQITEHVGK